MPHQWGATNPHQSRCQTPMHPMQTKSPLTLMKSRSAVTNHQRRPNSSHVHTNCPTREFSARSPIVRLQCVKILLIGTCIYVGSFMNLMFHVKKILLIFYNIFIKKI
jgi:hypothetical protein